MKRILTFLLTFLCFEGYCQKWHLNQIDKKSKFKFEYWFQFENLDDTCSYKVEKINGHLKSTIRLTDKYNDTLIIALIRITDLDNDSVKSVVIRGAVQAHIKPGNYRIEINATRYDKLVFALNISEGEYFNLTAKLGLAPELTVYQINSKNKLDEKEIFTIIQCVKANGRNFHKCSTKKYLVKMQI